MPRVTTVCIVLALFVVGLCVQSASAAFNWEWVNKDHKNTTNQPRNDITWIMAGHIKDAVVTTYNDGFGAPTITELPPEQDPLGRKWTKIDWPVRTTPINDGDQIHVGILIDRDKWPSDPGQLVGFFNAYWTLDNVQKEFVAGCAGIGLWARVDTVSILAQPPADSLAPDCIILGGFSYAIVDAPVDLPSLTFNNPSIPWVTLSAPDVPVCGDSVTKIIDITGTFDPTQYMIVQASAWFSGDDPSTAGHIIYQRRLKFTGVPSTTTWGMIILVSLLVLVPIVIFGVRRMRAVSR